MRLPMACLCVTLLATLTFTAQVVNAGKYNPTLNVGDAAPEFKDLPGTDDKNHSLAELKDKSVVVVIFTCNTCPTAVDYEDRVMALAKKYAGNGKVGIVAINANQVEGDLLPKMKERATERSFNFLYVHDDTQQVAKAYGATFTPEFFVLDATRKIAYMGALDDATKPDQVKVRYVEDAIDAVLAGRTPETRETIARGCLVRYARQRAKK